jgi:hypothetical protein
VPAEVSIVRSWTQATEFVCLFVVLPAVSLVNLLNMSQEHYSQTVWFPEMSVNFYQTTHCNMTEESTAQGHC